MSQSQSTKKIGLWTSTSLVIGNMIGAGVFLMPAVMASFGSVSLLGWLFAAIGSFFLARVFANLSKLLPGVTGGPYAYAHKGLGDFAGFLTAWGYYLGNAIALSTLVISILSGLTTFFSALATNPLIAVSVGLSIVWLVTWINTLGIVAGGRVQLITTILKIAPLLIITVCGLFYIHPENFKTFNSTGGSLYHAVSTAAAIAMFSYFGIECATIPAGSTEHAEKTVSRATILGLIVTAIIYTLGSIAVMGMIPAATLAHSATPFADAGVMIFGPQASYWVSAGIIIAALGALNGWDLVQGQVSYAIAKDKLFPKIFERQNKRGAPWFGIVFNSVLVSVFVLMNFSASFVDQFSALVRVAVLTNLIPFLFSVAAYPIIRARHHDQKGWTGAIILAILAFGYTLWMIAGSGEQAVYYGLLMILLGIPFYLWQVYKKEKEAGKL